MLVQGEGTDAYNVAVCRALGAAFPSPRTLILPGGHMSPVMAMDSFIANMQAFQEAERR
jgi:hypothetical protein